MKYGFVCYAETLELIELAQEAEKAGWDGFFIPDDYMTVWPRLTAMALKTERIKLGTMLTPLPEQDPWYVAAEAAVVDQISQGRVILTTGLGVLNLDKLGLPGNKVRAEQLDESLALITGWWKSNDRKNFTFQGKHYQMQPFEEEHFPWGTHHPVQGERLPIWVVGGKTESQIKRAARWDGASIDGTPEEIRERIDRIADVRGNRDFDVIKEGSTPLDILAAQTIIQPYVEAGITWWIESMWDDAFPYSMRERIQAGPPRLS